MDIIVDDNFIGMKDVKIIENEIIHLPWYFYSNTIGTKGYNPLAKDGLNQEDSSQFVHSLYAQGAPESPYYEKALALMNMFLDNNRMEPIAIIRAKSNLILNKNIGPEKYAQPHRDFKFDHKVFLYYVNDSDGATVFFDNDMNIIKEVEPVAGRAVIFDGRNFHANRWPVVSDYRSVINIVFV